MATSSPLVSSEVMWHVVGRHSAYQRVSHGVRLTVEPLNVMGRSTYKYSGLVQPRAVGIVPVEAEEGDDEGEDARERSDGLVLEVKTKKHDAKPAQGRHEVNVKHSYKRGVKAIHLATAAAHYRPDLRSAALARFARLRRSFNPRAGKVPTRTVGAKRTERAVRVLRRKALTEEE